MADLKDYSDVCSVSDVESSDHVLSRFIAGSFRRDDLSAWPLRTTIPPLFSSILFNRVASFAPPFSTSGTELKMYNVVGTVIEVRRMYYTNVVSWNTVASLRSYSIPWLCRSF